MASCHTVIAVAFASFVWDSPTACATDAGDASVLKAIYNISRNDDDNAWLTATNWLVNKPCTNSWYGVVCVNGAITMLSLPNNNVGPASVPTEIGLPTALTSTSLAENSLTGPLPTELGNLQIKSGLYFYFNSLSQTIPTQIGRLTDLTQSLELDNNILEGPLPTEMGRMVAYDTSNVGEEPPRNAWLNANSLTGSIPSEFANLEALMEGLYLQSNCLSGTVPSQMGEMTLLARDFYIESNGLWGSIPTQLGKLTAITSGFYMRGNSLSQQVPTELGRLSDIVSHFDISSNHKLCGDLPTEIQALSNQINPGYNIYEKTDIGDACPSKPSPATNHGRCALKDEDNTDSGNWAQFFTQFRLVAIGLVLAILVCALSILVCVYNRRKRGRARESRGGQLPMPTWKPTEEKSDGDVDVPNTPSTLAVMERLSNLVAGNGALRSFLLDFKLLQIEARPIAAGGAGQVCRGAYCGDVVAIKTVYSQMVDSADVDDICHEASLLAQIHNPRFVRLYGIALKGPIIHVVTEYVDQTLLGWFQKSAPGDDREGFCAAVTQLLEGIDFIHQRGLSHRDLKPQNVLMTADAWNVKICDLGMSRMNTAGKQQTMTVGVGSPLYMPPEAILDEEEIRKAIEVRSNSEDVEDVKVKKRYDASAWGKWPALSLHRHFWPIYFAER